MLSNPIIRVDTNPMIVGPIYRNFIMENIISPETMLFTLKLIFIVMSAILIGLLLHKDMEQKNFKTNKAVTLALSAVMAVGLSLRFGMSIYTFQGLFLFFLLLYASFSDLTSREVPNHISISILALSLISIPKLGLTSMLIGGLIACAIMTVVAMCNGGRGAGADMKITAACAFLVGCSRGLIGIIIGELIAIVVTLIYRKARGKDCKASFPYLPFLALGMMIAFMI